MNLKNDLMAVFIPAGMSPVQSVLSVDRVLCYMMETEQWALGLKKDYEPTS